MLDCKTILFRILMCHWFIADLYYKMHINTLMIVDLFVYFRLSVKICEKGRTWSCRSCQSQCGAGRATAWSHWVRWSTCHRSTSRAAQMRWGGGREPGSNNVTTKLNQTCFLICVVISQFVCAKCMLDFGSVKINDEVIILSRLIEILCKTRLIGVKVLIEAF